MPSPSLIALAAAVLHVPGRPERILEIGCGDGDGVLFLAREFPAPGCAASTPPRRRSAGRSPGSGSTPRGGSPSSAGGPRALPYPDGFFDLVAQASGRLHPGEIARVLRPGGHLVAGRRAGAGSTWRLERPSALTRSRTGEAEGERFLVAPPLHRRG